MEQGKLINIINNYLGMLIGKNSRLIKRNYFHYTINGEYSALNRIGSTPESVKVSKWFNNFWIFLEIRFKIDDAGMDENKKISVNTCISLSVFQGEDDDEEKYQLFRAEWDDYNDPEEKHAQPHWHITSSQALENTLMKYANLSNGSDFIGEFEKEKENILDVKGIHFAMGLDWHKSGNYVQKMEDEQQVVKWLQMLLTHLRTELDYVMSFLYK